MASLLVPDAREDSRFAGDALVAGPPYARFFAGVPITLHGLKIGALCALDPKARYDVDPARLTELADLAALAGSLFGLKDEARVRAAWRRSRSRRSGATP